MSEMLEKILSNENIKLAQKKVYSNKGASGVDGVTVQELEEYMKENWNGTWETCSLRKWLNEEFVNAAFTDDEKAMIPMVTVSADKNTKYGTNPGNDTQDKVFLLSITEANKYFDSGSARQCKPTAYAIANGAYVNDSNGNCRWWLRSPGDNQVSAADVNSGGGVRALGHLVRDVSNAVRPALWIVQILNHPLCRKAISNFGGKRILGFACGEMFACRERALPVSADE